jgi:hypothetical protein
MDEKQLLKHSVLSSLVKYLFKFKEKTFEEIARVAVFKVVMMMIIKTFSDMSLC